MARGVSVFVVCVTAIWQGWLGAQTAMPGPGQAGSVAPAPRIAAAAGVIRGRVLRADTGTPLAGASVTIVRSFSSDRREVITDKSGAYEMRNVPPGRYSIAASKAGYVPNTRAPMFVDLAEGQTVRSIDVSLPRAGAIEGRVSDAYGEPVVEGVVLLVSGGYADGTRGSGERGTYRQYSTDDRGVFRAHGLGPGTYYVVAQSTPPRGLGDQPLTYYPGTLLPAQAQPIELGVGQEFGGVTIQLVRGRMATVSGTVTSSDGRPATIGDLRLSGSPFASTGRALRDGSFSLRNVLPGVYTLSVRTEGGEFAEAPLTVEGADVSLALVTRPGGTVKGRIVFEPSPPSGTRPENVNLTFQDVSAGGELRIAEDWTFQAPNMVGSGKLRASSRVAGIPMWMLKAVLLKGADVTDTPVDFTRGIDDLEVVLTTRVTRVTGTVTDRRGASVRDATVLLFAEDPDRWATPNRFTRTARLNQNGQFIIEALPPGRYLAAAVDALGSGDEQDPQVLERLRQSATRLTLGEGEQRTLALRVTNR